MGVTGALSSMYVLSTAPRSESELTSRRIEAVMLFVLLQTLDFVTTLIGFQLGASEANPFVRALMGAGPVAGVALSKAIALALAGICFWLGRPRVIRWANRWFTALCAWNVCVIMAFAVG